MDIINRTDNNPEIRERIKSLIGTPIPQMEKIKPILANYDFPSFIEHTNNTDVSFSMDISDESADLVISQAAMEHVDDLEGTIKNISRMLKRGGVSTYQVDLKCHGTSKWWNGHWMYSPLEWKIIRGRVPYLINRASLSKHLALHKKYGLKIRGVKVFRMKTELPRAYFALEFRNIPEDDLTASSAFICSEKE